VRCKSRQFVGQKAIHSYSKSGFSLVELILAMGISTVILIAIYSVFTITSKNFTTQNATASAQQSLRTAIGLMARDIRAAGLDPIDSDNFGFEHATRTKIGITADSIDGSGEFNGTVDDTNFERITYEFKDNQIEQTLYGDTASAAPLISNIDDVEFKYFDSANNDLGDPVPADQREDIRTVEIQITVMEPAGIDEPVSRTLTRRVECRNMAFN
jgi:prepilin-type N-terminal cleavage/methylation domain-containing protein